MKNKFKVLIIFIILFFSFFNVSSADSTYLNIDKKINDKKITITITSKDVPIYGLLAKVNYDKENFEYDNCTTSNNYEVTFENNYLLIENTKGFSNEEIAKCTFNITGSATADDFLLENVSISNGTKTIDIPNDSINPPKKTIAENISKVISNPQTGSMFFRIFIIAIISLAITIKDCNYKKNIDNE